jgi:hypothetical protein
LYFAAFLLASWIFSQKPRSLDFFFVTFFGIKAKESKVPVL